MASLDPRLIVESHMENAVIEAVTKAVNTMDEAQLRSLVTDAYVEVRENS